MIRMTMSLPLSPVPRARIAANPTTSTATFTIW